MKRKVQAQRKFAQGAFVPTNITNNNADRRTDQAPQRDQEQVHKNVFPTLTTAKSFLDYVCFRRIHTHVDPIAVSEPPYCFPEVPQEAEPPHRISPSPKHSLDVSKRLLRHLNTSKSLKKRSSMRLRSAGRPAVHYGLYSREFSIEDDRPLTYFTNRNRANEAATNLRRVSQRKKRKSVKARENADRKKIDAAATPRRPVGRPRKIKHGSPLRLRSSSSHNQRKNSRNRTTQKRRQSSSVSTSPPRARRNFEYLTRESDSPTPTSQRDRSRSNYANTAKRGRKKNLARRDPRAATNQGPSTSAGITVGRGRATNRPQHEPDPYFEFEVPELLEIRRIGPYSPLTEEFTIGEREHESDMAVLTLKNLSGQTKALTASSLPECQVRLVKTSLQEISRYSTRAQADSRIDTPEAPECYLSLEQPRPSLSQDPTTERQATYQLSGLEQPRTSNSQDLTAARHATSQLPGLEQPRTSNSQDLTAARHATSQLPGLEQPRTSNSQELTAARHATSQLSGLKQPRTSNSQELTAARLATSQLPGLEQPCTSTSQELTSACHAISQLSGLEEPRPSTSREPTTACHTTSQSPGLEQPPPSTSRVPTTASHATPHSSGLEQPRPSTSRVPTTASHATPHSSGLEQPRPSTSQVPTTASHTTPHSSGLEQPRPSTSRVPTTASHTTSQSSGLEQPRPSTSRVPTTASHATPHSSGLEQPRPSTSRVPTTACHTTSQSPGLEQPRPSTSRVPTTACHTTSQSPGLEQPRPSTSQVPTTASHTTPHSSGLEQPCPSTSRVPTTACLTTSQSPGLEQPRPLTSQVPTTASHTTSQSLGLEQPRPSTSRVPTTASHTNSQSSGLEQPRPSTSRVPTTACHTTSQSPGLKQPRPSTSRVPTTASHTTSQSSGLKQPRPSSSRVPTTACHTTSQSSGLKQPRPSTSRVPTTACHTTSQSTGLEQPRPSTSRVPTTASHTTSQSSGLEQPRPSTSRVPTTASHTTSQTSEQEEGYTDSDTERAGPGWAMQPKSNQVSKKVDTNKGNNSPVIISDSDDDDDDDDDDDYADELFQFSSISDNELVKKLNQQINEAIHPSNESNNLRSARYVRHGKMVKVRGIWKYRNERPDSPKVTVKSVLDYPKSDINTCPCQFYENLEDVLDAPFQDIRRRCRRCGSCYAVKKILCLTYLFQASVGLNLLDSNGLSAPYLPAITIPREENGQSLKFPVDIVKKSTYLMELNCTWLSSNEREISNAQIVPKVLSAEMLPLNIRENLSFFKGALTNISNSFKKRKLEPFKFISEDSFFANAANGTTISDIILQAISSYEAIVTEIKKTGNSSPIVLCKMVQETFKTLRFPQSTILSTRTSRASNSSTSEVADLKPLILIDKFEESEPISQRAVHVSEGIDQTHIPVTINEADTQHILEECDEKTIIVPIVIPMQSSPPIELANDNTVAEETLSPQPSIRDTENEISNQKSTRFMPNYPFFRPSRESARQPKSPGGEKSGCKKRDQGIAKSKKVSEPKVDEAPIYHPTEEEFEDPIKFFCKIMPEAAKYGLCKIVAPKGFKPECTLNNDMRFSVTNQYICRLFTRWGPASREMCCIKSYLATQSVFFLRPPLLEGVEVNLPKLYQLVQRLGGLKQVIEKKRWNKVAEEMCLTRSPKSDKKIDRIYVKYILPYDTLSNVERFELMRTIEDYWTDRSQRMINRAKNPLHKKKRLLGESDSSEDEDVPESHIIDALSEAEDCFVNGRVMTLETFQKVAKKIMYTYFGRQKTPKDIEKCYWNLVVLAKDHLCVNTASIDTGEEGYGFPKNPRDPGGKHPWNLKMLSQNNGNVLRFLGPVLGVTVPTLHLGMVFSTSCWHRDPHGLPWIEYLHNGPSKIWYGIPESESAKFRRAAELLCPTLCQNKAIWLPSDIAMIPPSLLLEHGVRLTRVVQRTNEFVLIFPKSYSCSVSTGYTESESVYFATDAWLDAVHEVFHEVRESCEPTMFPLEKLLLAAAQDTTVPLKQLYQVYTLLKVIIDEEIANRASLAALNVKCEYSQRHLRQRPSRSWNIREQEECEVCRTTLYLSRVRGLIEKSSVCPQHALLMFQSPKHQRAVDTAEIEIFFKETELLNILKQVETRLSVNKSPVEIPPKQPVTITAEG